MVHNHSFSKQIATASNDSMVFVWNLNQSGNIYKYIGHRVSIFLFRTQSLMLNFHHLEINSPVAPKMRLLKYGLTMPKEIPLPLRPIMLLLELWTTVMMENSFWHVLMTKPSKFIEFRRKRTSSPWLDIKIGSKPATFHLITGWFAQEVRTKPSFSGTLSHKRCFINSVSI